MRDVSLKKPQVAAQRSAAVPAPADVNRMLLDVARSTASHRDLPSLLRDLLGVLRGVARFDRLGLVLYDPARDIMWMHTVPPARPPPTTAAELPPAHPPPALPRPTRR